MSNIYDIFRGVQARKTSCYDERSAAFITEGLVSQDITHVRLNKVIKAAITFNDKEGPDESIVYTLKELPSGYIDVEATETFSIVEDQINLLLTNSVKIGQNINVTVIKESLSGIITELDYGIDFSIEDESNLIILTTSDVTGTLYTITYTYLRAVNEELLKGDYFIYNNGYYLVYEDVKLTDNDLTWKKQRAVECNVVLNIGDDSYYAYFISSLRRGLDSDLEKNAAIVPNEGPLVIVPSNAIFTIGLRLTIGSKPWKVVEYDNISNAGITYLYLERGYTPTLPEIEEEEEEESGYVLVPMVEYTFDTIDAYFISVPKVNIISKKSTSIKFSVPYGIDAVTITTKDKLGAEVIQKYEVTL